MALQAFQYTNSARFEHLLRLNIEAADAVIKESMGTGRTELASLLETAMKFNFVFFCC